MESVWCENVRIASLLFVDGVVLLAPSDFYLQFTMGHFAVKCEAARIGVITSKTEAMVLSQKTVDCSLQVASESLPQVKELKYLRGLVRKKG